MFWNKHIMFLAKAIHDRETQQIYKYRKQSAVCVFLMS